MEEKEKGSPEGSSHETLRNIPEVKIEMDELNRSHNNNSNVNSNNHQHSGADNRRHADPFNDDYNEDEYRPPAPAFYDRQSGYESVPMQHQAAAPHN